MRKTCVLVMLIVLAEAAPTPAAEPKMIREVVRALYTTFVEWPNPEALLAGALRGLVRKAPGLKVEIQPPPGRYLLRAEKKELKIGMEAIGGANELAEALQAAIKFAVERYGGEMSALEQAAAREMLAECGERWTSFIGSAAMPGLFEDGSGEMGSCGIVPVLSRGQLSVLDVEAGSPADKAGVRRGESIEKIAGFPAGELSEMEAVALLRGKKGQTIEVVVGGKALVLEAAASLLKNIEVDPPENGIARVRLSDFRAETAKRLSAVLEKLAGMGLRGLVLDLRGNPGGLVDEGAAVVGLFTEAGTVAFIVDRGHRRAEALKNPVSGKYRKLPLVLLVDGRSASVSELVALALRDLRKVKLVGEKTLGKGVVQVLVELSDGSAMKISTARFASPSGVLFYEGLEPDLEVPMAGDGRDAALEKAVAILKGS